MPAAAFERWADLPLVPERFGELAARAREARVDLVVVGPDNALAEGVVDVCERAGLLCFGPTAGAARIEASKSFAKEIMRAAGVPTARFFVAESRSEAEKILRSVPWEPPAAKPAGQEGGWVLKADGLALGKGVVVCSSYAEAEAALESLLRVSGRLVIEEKLRGFEVSWMAFCDGERCALLDPARDYKRLRDGDQGPNTGGMGAVSPVPGLPEGLEARVRERVFLPTLREMKKRGIPFKGLLYAGLMVDPTRPPGEDLRVLEFNARFGDPETQVLLPRLSGDLYAWCEAAARGDLGRMREHRVRYEEQAAVFVVAAARGYPENPEKGRLIESGGADGVFFAGVRRRGEGPALETAGGRVLGALGRGDSIEAARRAAYARLAQVRFEGMQARADIGAVPGKAGAE